MNIYKNNYIICCFVLLWNLVSWPRENKGCVITGCEMKIASGIKGVGVTGGWWDEARMMEMHTKFWYENVTEKKTLET